MTTPCPHTLAPLYQPTTGLAGIDIALRGLGRYLVCAACGRIGTRGPNGFRWLEPEEAERRHQDAEEFGRHFEGREPKP